MHSSPPRYVLGVDLGKATLCYALGRVSPDGAVVLESEGCRRHLGRPAESFAELWMGLDTDHVASVAATGVYGASVIRPAIGGIPDEIAQELAARWLWADRPALNLLRLGASGYSLLALDPVRPARFEPNERCSSGTGETMEKICKRLGLDFDAACGLAVRAEESIPISARCSVFAKSEITHWANQGASREALLRGYFESVARNVFALAEKHRGVGPILLVGNGASVSPLVLALAEQFSVPVEVPDHAPIVEAIGAMLIAAEQAPEAMPVWPADGAELIRTSRTRFRHLRPPAQLAARVRRLESSPESLPPGAPVLLGLDLGSTGSKAALVGIRRPVVVDEWYRRTDGNPVEAAQSLLRDIEAENEHPIIGIALTGSGRYAAASVFRAVIEDAGGRVDVHNEIVAHASAAAHFDPDGGASLSVVEIGGQDAKFINIKQGRVVDSDMNRACSAGTGSFLEEQARLYGMNDITLYGALADRAVAPPDLGQMCTVFVADMANEALQEGFELADVLAGFQYSVIFNYLHRVKGSRGFLDRIFFQGKPACNPSLARTLAEVSGRDVVVPSSPGGMGAIGAALLSRQALGDRVDPRPIELRKILAAEVVSRRDMRCKVPECGNLCRIEVARVAVGDGVTRVVSGGQCARWEEPGGLVDKLAPDAPNAFRERAKLLDALLREDVPPKDGPTLGIPCGHVLVDTLPFFHRFFTRLGFAVQVLHSNEETLAVGERRSTCQNSCTPLKILHGLASTELDLLFMPKIERLAIGDGDGGLSTCPLVQAAPELVDHALMDERRDVRVLRPVFDFERGLSSQSCLQQLRRMVGQLSELHPEQEPSSSAVDAAWRAAAQVQKSYQRGLLEIGRRTVAYGHRHDLPVVLVAGNAHVIHESLMNAGIDELLAANGALPLPLGCFEVEPEVPPFARVYWSMANRTLRASVQAVRTGGVFPLLLLSYGCGPASFLENLFNEVLDRYPHTVLESDGHGGQAGYLTRVQAFLHSAVRYRAPAESPLPQVVLDSYDDLPDPPEKIRRESRTIVGATGPNIGRQLAVMLRARGYRAECTQQPDESSFAVARGSCSGKECLPYQILWGSVHRHLQQDDGAEQGSNLIVNVSGLGPCRNGMFALGNEVTLRRLGLERSCSMMSYEDLFGDLDLLGDAWYSVVSTDVLNLMRFWVRAGESEPGASDRLFQAYSERIDGVFEGSRPGLLSMASRLRTMEAIIDEAARDYRALLDGSPPRDDLRTVFLAGDILLRIDDWGSGELTRRLNEQGLRVLLEPFCSIMEFLAFHRSRELIGLDDRWLQNQGIRVWMRTVLRSLYGAAARHCPWVRYDDAADVAAESRQLLDGTPFSECLLTLGSSLMVWQHQSVDGIVIVSPLGCGPAYITEAQLRRRRDIPVLFLYNSGDLVSDGRISGFVWRLRRQPPR